MLELNFTLCFKNTSTISCHHHHHQYPSDHPSMWYRHSKSKILNTTENTLLAMLACLSVLLLAVNIMWLFPHTICYCSEDYCFPWKQILGSTLFQPNKTDELRLRMVVWPCSDAVCSLQSASDHSKKRRFWKHHTSSGILPTFLFLLLPSACRVLVHCSTHWEKLRLLWSEL